MKKIFFTIIITIFFTETKASIKKNIIQNLKNTNNLTFEFEQNISGKIENGNCTLEYPKKIFCKYNLGNKKIMVSNGKALVIKTSSSYYKYPIDKTPLNQILDKKYLLNKIKKLEFKNIDNKFINFKFIENENEINIFFDINTYNLIGWQTVDIYQNLSIVYLSSFIKNKNINKNLFLLPTN
tara:strand:- start:1692 stop:2237 length:546 start_codon:yes stop_codon:yes gene_type:complete